MIAQLDDDGLWWHMLASPNKTHMKGNVLLLFGQFHHSNVIFMVAHSL
jgi:hypothetical protein